jgi:cyclohexanone monooxygenase
MPLDNQSLATQAKQIDVLVVGAGFAGLYLLHRLSKLGLVVRAFEAGGGVGGTWYWNRYPGARCDVESMQYSFGFSEELQQDWQWSELFSAQPEILSYANHVADRFDLRRFITFNARVNTAIFDEASARWTVHTSTGETVIARYVVMATGCLSTGRVPDFPGIETFQG